MIFDNRACQLGEGPLWHPVREQLFWFDITGRRLLTRKGEKAQEWHFAEMVSAAGWTGDDTLFIASETGLFEFDLCSGERTPVCALEANNTATRRKILHCALHRFADCGYAGASVQEIVDAARVTKPALYYYFGSKSGLYQALIDMAHDERYRLKIAVLGAGRNLHLERLLDALAARAAARLARLLDHRAVAAAAGARVREREEAV